MSSKLQAYRQDVWFYRVLGVGLYQSVLDLAVFILVRAAPIGRKAQHSKILILACTFFLTVLQLLPSTVLAFVLRVFEPQPLQIKRLIPRNLISQVSAFVQPLSRVLARARHVGVLSRSLALLASYSVSGAFFVPTYVYLRDGQPKSGTFLHGALLGFCYAVYELGRGGDILVFPTLQRHRLFRVKQKLIPALEAAVKVPPAAILLHLLLGILGLVPVQGVWGSLLLKDLVADLVCTYCWTLGLYVTHIIFTERLTFAANGDDDPNAPLFQALQNDKEEVLQAAAFLEVCTAAELQGKGAWRRQQIFADDTGTAWKLPAQVLIKEIESLTEIVANGLPQSSRTTTSMQAPKWNQLPLGSKAVVVPDRQQGAAAWQIRTRYQRVAWAVRALAGFAAASREEDRFGVLQLTEPRLGPVVQAILSLLLVLQQHAKFAATSKRRAKATETDGFLEKYAHGLIDIAQTGVCQLSDVFGTELQRAVAGAGTTPLFGMPAELSALISASSAYQ